jgi:hypothetical protein
MAAAPIKTYALVNNGTLTHRNMELRHGNMPFLFITQDTFGLPRLKFRTQSHKGPVVAAAKLPLASRGVQVYLGDPDGGGGAGAGWTPVDNDNWLSLAAFSFRGVGDGHVFTWKKTHSHGRWAPLFFSFSFFTFVISVKSQKTTTPSALALGVFNLTFWLTGFFFSLRFHSPQRQQCEPE